MSVTYKDWENFAHKRFENLSTEYEEVFAGGLCLGAILALSIGEKYRHRVKGILALSTTLFLDGTRMPCYRFLLPVGFYTLTRFFYRYPESEPYGIKNEKFRYIIKRLLEKNSIGLDNFPLTCVYELDRMSKPVQKDLRKIFAPIIIIHSAQDDLTSPKSAYKVYNEISSDDKEIVILKNSYHMILYDNERDYVFTLCSKFLLNHSNESEKILC